MPDAPDVRLEIAGLRYGGWQQIRIQRSIEQIAGQFSLAVSERWKGQDEPRPIRPGDTCRVSIDGVPVITGYVDDVEIAYDAESHTVSVSGRDRTADLVDCSAPIAGGNLMGQTLLAAAEKLCEPFGIDVTTEVDVGGAFGVIRTNPGESVFDRLDAGAKARAVLLITDGEGDLVITRASAERIPTVLLLGDNIRACAARFSHKDRFGQYTVTSQREAKDQEVFNETAFHITSTVGDGFVARHRPLIVLAENLSGLDDATQRAKWERNVRFGRSQSLQYTVQGWHYEPGKLWPINRMVPVRDEYLGIDADRLITGVTYTLDDDGLRTELTLMPREAFELLPLPDAGGDNWDQI